MDISTPIPGVEIPTMKSLMNPAVGGVKNSYSSGIFQNLYDTSQAIVSTGLYANHRMCGSNHLKWAHIEAVGSAWVDMNINIKK